MNMVFRRKRVSICEFRFGRNINVPGLRVKRRTPRLVVNGTKTRLNTGHAIMGCMMSMPHTGGRQVHYDIWGTVQSTVLNTAGSEIWHIFRPPSAFPNCRRKHPGIRFPQKRTFRVKPLSPWSPANVNERAAQQALEVTRGSRQNRIGRGATASKQTMVRSGLPKTHSAG